MFERVLRVRQCHISSAKRSIYISVLGVATPLIFWTFIIIAASGLSIKMNSIWLNGQPCRVEHCKSNAFDTMPLVLALALGDVYNKDTS